MCRFVLVKMGLHCPKSYNWEGKLTKDRTSIYKNVYIVENKDGRNVEVEK